MSILLDGVLALSQRVPQLDGLVPGPGHNLPVVRGEGHGHDVLSVVLKTAGSPACREIPQTEGLVPGAGQGKMTVRGEGHVRDEMSVSVESLLRNAVVVAIVPSQLPDDQ